MKVLLFFFFRNMTINELCMSVAINLQLTQGAGFYKASEKESCAADRRIVLRTKKKKTFIDDFTGLQLAMKPPKMGMNLPIYLRHIISIPLYIIVFGLNKIHKCPNNVYLYLSLPHTHCALGLLGKKQLYRYYGIR